ncbi:NACHT, LRR and PYD domains-containing protein 12-like isoform X2 [Aquarana catesbeiana]|uniref:NACHT, LRR and PYD domains-containing protein 12-like isoform X2 n=1 Tax=Aquarana catesbeiana TaxID=8400 RepID=UPI003CC96C8D
MGTSSSTSYSPQGSAPSILGKRKQNPRDLILYYLKDLEESDFMGFRNKLSDFSYGDERPIPRGRLENANRITTKDLLIDTYGGEGALDVTIEVFTLIGLMGPANDLQERRVQSAKLRKTHYKRLTGSAPGFQGKRKQTPEDLIVYSLEDLRESDFKRFKNKLSDFSYEDKHPIPRARLENEDWITTKKFLVDTYGEEGALDVTIKVFTLIGLMGPANDLQERRAQNANLKKMTHANRIPDLSKEHRQSMKEKFQWIPEYNSRMGETVQLQNRYTKNNLLMIKGVQIKEEKEEEIRSSGRRPLQIMEKRSSHKYSPTTIQALFDPDEDGFTPKVVVLQGPAGIGKTMTSKKIMLDWASGYLYQDKFDFLFYLSCTEINAIIGNISLVGLLSRACRQWSSDDLVSILQDPGSERKLLFILDGFDELRWTLEEKSEVCHDIFMETHKERILQSLLRRQVLPQSSLIITTRSLAIQKLNTFINDYRNVEIQGFTREDCEEYVHKFFGNKENADKVLGIIKDHELLYAMCAVPITCWILCTVLKPEIQKDLGSIRYTTVTSIYRLYLEVLITFHARKGQPVDWTPQALHTFLKNLCALANEGVLNNQIFFKEEDLKRHKLSLSEVKSMFLNENLFYWSVRTETCYSFIHQSVQEFFAALYYVLGFGKEEGISGAREQRSLPEICKGQSLRALSSQYPHLALAVQFLFGLLNENQVKTFSEITGINISLRVKSAIKEWTVKDFDGSSPIHAIVCLYETQDEDFIGSILSGCSHLRVDGSLSHYLWRDSNYSKKLSYCLKTLKSERFQNLRFEWLTVDPECQKNISPLLHRCQTVWFENCTFQKRYGTSFLRKDKTGDEEEEFSSSKDKMKPVNLSWLINPESKIEELGLIGCGLTSSCSNDLHSILITNPSLIKLDLSVNYLQDSGIKLLCDGLKDPSCTLQDLSLFGNNLTEGSSIHLASAIRNNQTLRKLDLSGNNLEGPHFSDLMKAVTTSRIEELLLNDNDLTDSSCPPLASIIRSNQTLRRLDLSWNNLEGPHFRDLMTALTTSQIEELLLNNNFLTDSSCPHLTSGIRNNQTLRRLDLSKNHLEGPHFRVLMEALTTSRIEELLLQNVKLTDEYAPFLVSLSKCTTLTALDLRFNRLTDASAKYIQDLILASTSLKDVRIDGNFLSSKAKETLGKKMDEIQNDVQLHQEGALMESAPSAESEEQPDNLVTPTLDGRTYRLELKPNDLFYCSETGIMFKVKSEVTIKYELELESDDLDKIQKKGYDVVGPMFNITVEPGVVSEVHLPHSLCLRGKLKQLARGRSCGEICPDSTAKNTEECAIDETVKVDSDTFLSSTVVQSEEGTSQTMVPASVDEEDFEEEDFEEETTEHSSGTDAPCLCKGLKRGIALIRCGNFKDGKCNIIKPVSIRPFQFTRQHAGILAVLAIAYIVWKHYIPYKGKVLLYGKVVCPEDMNYMEYKFHLYVIPRKQPEIRELDKQKKADGFKRLRKPHQIQRSLRETTEYTVGVQPHKKIFPKYLEFQGSCETKELPFVEVSVDRNAKDISMFVSIKNYSKENTEGSMEVIWEGDISEGKKKISANFFILEGHFYLFTSLVRPIIDINRMANKALLCVNIWGDIIKGKM